jgi:plasmid maintenance system antidote protein VapI
MGRSQNALARSIRVPSRRFNGRVPGKRSVTADTDPGLARYFGIPEGFFLGFQADFGPLVRRRRIGRDLAAYAPRAA